jgi:signal peptidase I
MVPVDKVVGRADRIGWPLGQWSALTRTGAFAQVPEDGGVDG